MCAHFHSQWNPKTVFRVALSAVWLFLALLIIVVFASTEMLRRQLPDPAAEIMFWPWQQIFLKFASLHWLLLAADGVTFYCYLKIARHAKRDMQAIALARFRAARELERLNDPPAPPANPYLVWVGPQLEEDARQRAAEAAERADAAEKAEIERHVREVRCAIKALFPTMVLIVARLVMGGLFVGAAVLSPLRWTRVVWSCGVMARALIKNLGIPFVCVFNFETLCGEAEKFWEDNFGRPWGPRAASVEPEA